MSDPGPAPGTTPSGGWRHRPRPVRAPRPDWPGDLDRSDWDPTGERPEVTPPPEACPWLFLAAEPNVRAGFVTDSHRCELRPDIVPGPGHQLAYCLTTNHVSCPQLRAYEGRRTAGAVGESTPPTAAPSAPTPPELPHAATANSAWRAEWVTRAPWIIAGALAALGLALMLALFYSTPSQQAVAPPVATPTPAPASTPALQEAAPQPQPATPSTDPLDRLDSEAAGASPPAEDADPVPEPTSSEAADDAATEETAGPSFVPYVVAPGDTLLVIAWRFGVPLDDLMAVNGLDFYSTIYHGQQLLVPLPGAQ